MWFSSSLSMRRLIEWLSLGDERFWISRIVLFCPQSVPRWSMPSLPVICHFPSHHHTPQQLIKPIHTYLYISIVVDLVLGPGYPFLVLYFFFIKNPTYKYFKILVSITLLVKNLLISPFRFLLEFRTTLLVVLQQLFAPFLRTHFILTCN